MANIKNPLTIVGGGNKVSQIAAKTITSLTADDLRGATTIEEDVFADCEYLNSVTIPTSVVNIKRGAFSRSGNETSCFSLTFEGNSSLISIGDSAFSTCYKLADIELPEGLQTIGYAVFAACDEELTEVTIPSTIISIGEEAFEMCDELVSVTILATTPPAIGARAFYDCHEDLVIYVPAGSVETYKAANGWSTYASIIQAIPS